MASVEDGRFINHHHFQELGIGVHFLRFAEHQRNGGNERFMHRVVADITIGGVQRGAVQWRGNENRLRERVFPGKR